MKSRSMIDDPMIFPSHLVEIRDVNNCSMINQVHTIINDKVYLHLLSHDNFDNLDNNKELEEKSI